MISEQMMQWWLIGVVIVTLGGLQCFDTHVGTPHRARLFLAAAFTLLPQLSLIGWLIVMAALPER